MTIEKIPSITATTASHDTSGDRFGGPVDSAGWVGWVEAVVAGDTDPVLSWGVTKRCALTTPAGTGAVFRRLPDVNPGPGPSYRLCAARSRRVDEVCTAVARAVP
ncbi:hypothetical protein ACFQ60_43225 [Streptomyces zhihengii]